MTEPDSKFVDEVKMYIAQHSLTSGGFVCNGWLQSAQKIRDALICKSHWDYRNALIEMAAHCFVELRHLENNFLENPVSHESKGKY